MSLKLLVNDVPTKLPIPQCGSDGRKPKSAILDPRGQLICVVGRNLTFAASLSVQCSIVIPVRTLCDKRDSLLFSPSFYQNFYPFEFGLIILSPLIAACYTLIYFS